MHPNLMRLRASSRTALVLALLLTGLTCNDAEEFEPGLRVLFVGNSLTYANDMPGMVERLLAAAGVEVSAVGVEALPNYGLQDHWARDETLRRIEDGAWDVVVLQQGPSATEGRPSLLEYSIRFAERIRSHGGRPALYMVWPSQARSFDFDGVSDSYRTAAESIDGLLFPAGEAWREAWQRDPGLRLYDADGFHPSMRGSYVAALVVVGQLADVDLTTLPAEISSEFGTIPLSHEEAALLQEAAAEANERFARP